MNFIRISCIKFTYEFAMNSLTKSKQREKFVRGISEIHVRILKTGQNCARILNKERNLCTNFDQPTKLHQDRHSKTSPFDHYLVSL